jgi:hypothetical protein
MYDATPPGPPRSGMGRIAAVVTLAVAVVGIIGVAFRGSWGALRDAALAAHFDRSAADLYPWGVDGLQVVAIIALVLLRHNRKARRYCLGIIIGYTGASWFINFLHGLGTFTPDPVTHIRPVPPWPVVFVIALLVIGSIFLGSHLLVFAWRYVFPDAAQPIEAEPVYQDVPPVDDDVPAVPELPADAFTVAKDAYRQSLHPDLRTLSQDVMVERFRISKREAARVQSEVKAELAAETAAAATPEPVDVPSQNGQGPA